MKKQAIEYIKEKLKGAAGEEESMLLYLLMLARRDKSKWQVNDSPRNRLIIRLHSLGLTVREISILLQSSFGLDENNRLASILINEKTYPLDTETISMIKSYVKTLTAIGHGEPLFQRADGKELSELRIKEIVKNRNRLEVPLSKEEKLQTKITNWMNKREIGIRDTSQIVDKFGPGTEDALVKLKERGILKTLGQDSWYHHSK